MPVNLASAGAPSNDESLTIFDSTVRLWVQGERTSRQQAAGTRKSAWGFWFCRHYAFRYLAPPSSNSLSHYADFVSEHEPLYGYDPSVPIILDQTAL